MKSAFFIAVVAATLALVYIISVTAAPENPGRDKMLKYNKRVSKKWLDAVAAEPGAVRMSDGVVLKVLKRGGEGGERAPKADTPVDCHYHGWLKDGSTFDSSYDRGSPATFSATQVIKGWRYLTMLAPGDVIMLWIPSELAYGDHGSPPKIPGGAALRFKLEVLKLAEGQEGRPVAEARAEFAEAAGKAWEDMEVVSE